MKTRVKTIEDKILVQGTTLNNLKHHEILLKKTSDSKYIMLDKDNIYSREPNDDDIEAEEILINKPIGPGSIYTLKYENRFYIPTDDSSAPVNIDRNSNTIDIFITNSNKYRNMVYMVDPNGQEISNLLVRIFLFDRGHYFDSKMYSCFKLLKTLSLRELKVELVTQGGTYEGDIYSNIGPNGIESSYQGSFTDSINFQKGYLFFVSSKGDISYCPDGFYRVRNHFGYPLLKVVNGININLIPCTLINNGSTAYGILYPGKILIRDIRNWKSISLLRFENDKYYLKSSIETRDMDGALLIKADFTFPFVFNKMCYKSSGNPSKRRLFFKGTKYGYKWFPSNTIITKGRIIAEIYNCIL